MIATGRIAFANARVRAMKSRLLGHEIAGRVLAGLGATTADWQQHATAFAELIEWYVTVLKSYPRGQSLFLSLLRRHEIENVKLLWRVIVNDARTTHWGRHWIDLGRLATLTIEAGRDCGSLPALIEVLKRGPYAAIAHDMWRAHGGDPAAAELGFDRWTSARIAEAAAGLPDNDRTAIALAMAIVRERDVNIAHRMAAAGLPVPPVRLPREWRRDAPAGGDHDRLVLWLRRRRRSLCRQAFREAPYCLAPAVALLLLKEEEVRGLDAIHWFDPASHEAAWLDYALAASELGV